MQNNEKKKNFNEASLVLGGEEIRRKYKGANYRNCIKVKS